MEGVVFVKVVIDELDLGAQVGLAKIGSCLFLPRKDIETGKLGPSKIM